MPGQQISQRSRTGTFVFCALAVLLTSPLAQSANRYVAPGGGDLNNDCSALANPCATIQHAIDSALAGDAVRVSAGTYSEAVNVNKSLSLLGAQANVDARSRTNAAETILDGGAIGAQPSIIVSAASVDINGFTFQNALAELRLNGSSGQLRNSVFIIKEGTTALQAWGSGNTVQQNLFKTTSAPASSNYGTGVMMALDSASGLSIDNNSFQGYLTSAIVARSVLLTQPTADLTITNNSFDSTGSGVSLFNMRTAAITHNTFANTIGSFSAEATGVIILRQSSDVMISQNVLATGAKHGIELANFIDSARPTNYPRNTNVTIQNNDISGFPEAGLYIDLDTSLLFARLAYSGVLDATCNWWGAASWSNNGSESRRDRGRHYRSQRSGQLCSLEGCRGLSRSLFRRSSVHKESDSRADPERLFR